MYMYMYNCKKLVMGLVDWSWPVPSLPLSPSPPLSHGDKEPTVPCSSQPAAHNHMYMYMLYTCEDMVVTKPQTIVDMTTLPCLVYKQSPFSKYKPRTLYSLRNYMHTCTYMYMHVSTCTCTCVCLNAWLSVGTL